MFGDVLVGELPERLLLAPRMLAEYRELRRLDRCRNADALRTSRLWAPGGQPAVVARLRFGRRQDACVKLSGTIVKDVGERDAVL